MSPPTHKDLVSGTKKAYAAAENSARAAALEVTTLACEAVATALAKTGRAPDQVVRATHQAALSVGFSSDEIYMLTAQASAKALIDAGLGRKNNVSEMLKIAEQVAAAAGLAEEDSIHLMGEVAARCISPDSMDGKERRRSASAVMHEASESRSFSKAAALQAVQLMAEDALANQQDKSRLSPENLAMLQKAATSAGLSLSQAEPLLSEFNLKSVIAHAFETSSRSVPKVASAALLEVSRVACSSLDLKQATVLALHACSQVLAAAGQSPAEVAEACLLIRVGSTRSSLGARESFLATTDGLLKAGAPPGIIGEVVKHVAEGIATHDERFGPDQAESLVVLGVEEAVMAVTKLLAKNHKTPRQIADAAYKLCTGAGLPAQTSTETAASVCSRVMCDEAMRANRSADSIVSSVLEVVNTFPVLPALGLDPVRATANFTITALAERAGGAAEHDFDPAAYVANAVRVAKVAGMSLDDAEEGHEIGQIILASLAGAFSSRGGKIDQRRQHELMAVAKGVLLNIGPSVENAVSVSRWLAGALVGARCSPEDTVQAVVELANSFGMRSREAEEVCMNEVAQGAIASGLLAVEVGSTVKV